MANHLPVGLKEEGVTCGLPPDGCVNAVIGDVCTIGAQWLWVARLQIGFPEKPVAVTCTGSSELCEEGPGLGKDVAEEMLSRVQNPFSPSLPSSTHVYTGPHVLRMILMHASMPDTHGNL